jgi:hypothetical protein
MEGLDDDAGSSEFGLDREWGSLEITSEAAGRVTSSDDDVDRERGSLEGTSEVADGWTSSEFLDEGAGPSEVEELFVSVTSIVTGCGDR